MKNACKIVQDLLPLYLENMVSDETAAFIKEHLDGCSQCFAELESMKSGEEMEPEAKKAEPITEDEIVKAIKSVRKKFRKKAFCVAGMIVAVLVVCSMILRFFPVWRIVQIGPMAMDHSYTGDEIGMALNIGSASDRREAQAVLRVADQAFHDTRHTRAENEREYGLLARYATDVDSYPDAAFCEYFLELWSAHLGKEEGWIWVYYSSETFNYDGSTACSSQGIPSLWKVEKNHSGEWVVVQIREHP